MLYQYSRLPFIGTYVAVSDCLFPSNYTITLSSGSFHCFSRVQAAEPLFCRCD